MKATASMLRETKINALQKIHAEFRDILKHEKCRSCSCFYADVLNRILEKLKTYRKGEADHRLAIIENDFRRWSQEADILKVHG
ncbi:MAG: hypothetical protein PVG19_01010 [Desulfobacterales bacterium]|jgi:hypothetical protein